MSKNREGYFVSKTHRECTECSKIFEKTSSLTICKKCNTSRVKSQSTEVKMYRRAKARAKLSNKEFTISVQDIRIPSHCPILKIPLKTHSGRPGGTDSSPSLDRKDNSKGYTPDNIWVISKKANVMKSYAHKGEMLLFAEWVLKEYGESNMKGYGDGLIKASIIGVIGILLLFGGCAYLLI